MKIAFYFQVRKSKAQMGLEIAEHFEVAKAVLKKPVTFCPIDVTDILSEEPHTNQSNRIYATVVINGFACNSKRLRTRRNHTGCDCVIVSW